MSRTCCKLHRFLDNENFTTNLSNERFKDFCSFLQTSSNKKNRSLVPLENPNDKEVYIYLFGGVGTRYLTTVLGEFIAFVSNMKTSKTKWFPVIGIKKTVQTKSLTILGSAKLPIALLLLLSYYENNLKYNYDCNDVFELCSHMSITSLIPSLLYLLEQTNDILLQRVLIKKLTTVTLCDNNEITNSFQATTFSNSFSTHPRVVTGYFGSHLTLYCNDKLPLTQEEQEQETWKNKILTLLMMKNWTEIQSGWNNSSTTLRVEPLNFHLYQSIQQQQQQHQYPMTMIPFSHPPPPPPPMQAMEAQAICQEQQHQETIMEQCHPYQQPWPEFK